MSKLNIRGDIKQFFCPGCQQIHQVGSGWTWNQSTESPTFTPSILVTSGHYSPGYSGSSCWCSYNATHRDEPSSFVCCVCHSFITEGKIQFLSDSTHPLAGQTVELPTIDAEEPAI